MTDTFLDRDRERRNNFGVLRLFFAICVILSHTFPAISEEMNKNEVLLRPTGRQMDLGALAVNAFFAISGYLITQSWLRSPKFRPYLTKRALRIYPGFIVASVLSVFVLAPYIGATYESIFSPLQLTKTIARLCFLSPPRAVGAFTGSPIPELNLPLWTIRYEFLCYLLVPLLLYKAGGIGRVGVLALYLISLGVHAAQGSYLVAGNTEIPILGKPTLWPRFLTYFVGGAAFVLNGDRIPFRAWLFGVCIVILALTAFVTGGFFIATATAGIYAVFYLAFQKVVRQDFVGEKWDLSYGTYLYGWPIQMLVIKYLYPAAGPWRIFLVSLALTLVAAALSWVLVERPFLRKKPTEVAVVHARPQVA